MARLLGSSHQTRSATAVNATIPPQTTPCIEQTVTDYQQQSYVSETPPHYPGLQIIGSALIWVTDQRVDATTTAAERDSKYATDVHTRNGAPRRNIKPHQTKQRGVSKRSWIQITTQHHSLTLPVKLLDGKNFSNKNNLGCYTRGTWGCTQLSDDFAVAVCGMNSSSPSDACPTKHTINDVPTRHAMVGMNLSNNADSYLKHPTYMLSTGRGNKVGLSMVVLYSRYPSKTMQVDSITIDPSCSLQVSVSHVFNATTARQPSTSPADDIKTLHDTLAVNQPSVQQINAVDAETTLDGITDTQIDMGEVNEVDIGCESQPEDQQESDYESDGDVSSTAATEVASPHMNTYALRRYQPHVIEPHRVIGNKHGRSLSADELHAASEPGADETLARPPKMRRTTSDLVFYTAPAATPNTLYRRRASFEHLDDTFTVKQEDIDATTAADTVMKKPTLVTVSQPMFNAYCSSEDEDDNLSVASRTLTASPSSFDELSDDDSVASESTLYTLPLQPFADTMLSLQTPAVVQRHIQPVPTPWQSELDDQVPSHIYQPYSDISMSAFELTV